METSHEHFRSGSPKAAEHSGHRLKSPWVPITAAVAGLLSLAWFLARVLPKPSRAAYPCQRAAAPLAGGFLIWLASTVASALGWRRAKHLWKQWGWGLAGVCLLVAAIMAVGAIVGQPPAQMAGAPVPNQPIGVGKGIHPGRVVWVHDPSAARWPGPGQGHWWESEHTDQAAVDRMMSTAIRRLAGQPNEKKAWEALFKHFNKTRGRGNAGYRKGEKITIKVNLVGCIVGGRQVDSQTYELVRQQDYMNTSPQMMVALLRQLVGVAGANQEDISIGDPLALFPKPYYDYCRRDFPNVRYLDHAGGNAENPRTRVQPSSVPFYWSARPAGKTQDYVPTAYAEATYFINMANLKAHTLAGVTLCAKNHYGSLRRPPEKGYYDMHETLARKTPAAGQYRALVDLMGHAHTGGKTLLYFIDGLYPGVHPSESVPRKFSMPPFHGQWAASLFASQDPVAIDSVGFDFLWAEWSDHPHIAGADDYLHEAALADKPPSGTFYDPDHPTNTKRLASLGVHEHWNNAQDKQYSRNLGKRAGIELVKVGPGAT